MPEAAELARSRAPGREVRTGLSSQVGFEERSFDVVCAFHVLEHMPDTRAFLAELARYARPGGVVVVETPNYASRLRRVQGERWLHLRPLEHLVHFTPQTMRARARGAGLEPLRVTNADLDRPRAHARRARRGARPARVPRGSREPSSRLYRRRGVGAVVLAAGRVGG
jgi:SAM-dependent methyltransferase